MWKILNISPSIELKMKFVKWRISCLKSRHVVLDVKSLCDSIVGLKPAVADFYGLFRATETSCKHNTHISSPFKLKLR